MKQPYQAKHTLWPQFHGKKVPDFIWRLSCNTAAHSQPAALKLLCFLTVDATQQCYTLAYTCSFEFVLIYVIPRIEHFC